MIQANELRIGSSIEYFTPELEWVLKTVDVEDILQHVKSNDFIKEYYRPISITEEWLLKLGFERIEFDDIISFWTIEFSDGYYLEFNIMIGYTSISIKEVNNIVGDTTIYLKTNIEYVHQLQNIYFALTGEELIIKE
jgi:hypothetical protein